MTAETIVGIILAILIAMVGWLGGRKLDAIEKRLEKGDDKFDSLIVKVHNMETTSALCSVNIKKELETLNGSINSHEKIYHAQSSMPS
jgi:hypothetical protein